MLTDLRIFSHPNHEELVYGMRLRTYSICVSMAVRLVSTQTVGRILFILGTQGFVSLS
jgi:hypothetical protein